MARAAVRFYAELNDHLAPEDRYRTLDKDFLVPGSLKDFIESCGVPHTEVDLATVNGESSDFSRLVRDGDRVAVYPVFEALDITPVLRLRPRPLREPKFVLDVHLGRLAAYLRMLGLDAFYRNRAGDPELVLISVEQKRILLTRDRGLLMHSAVTHGYWLRQTDSRRQTAEVVRRFDLGRRLRPFTRCMACNELLSAASREEVAARVPPGVVAGHEEFRECPGCRRIYWQGSHYLRMRRWIDQLAAPMGAA
ncbi:MAG TPA: Mut7-C RNAse domain-containing protein [Candidatus Sulfopaludibacter sp.]|nr:Mut7-C RNAse domain-containing protein [Candidatus Sulfopaludibacter sp.]